MIFKQAKDTPLNALSGNVPDVSDALNGWLSKMSFIKIAKTIIDFKVSEIETSIDFEGVWDGIPRHQLNLKPEGERAWKWYNVWAKTNLELNPDDKILYLGTKYRIMSENDYSHAGYHQYELVEDFV